MDYLIIDKWKKESVQLRRGFKMGLDLREIVQVLCLTLDQN